MLRRLAFAPKFRPVAICSRVHPVTYTQHVRRQQDDKDTYGRRERTLEDLTVRKHEQHLIDDLAKQLKKKDDQLARARGSGAGESSVEQARQEFEDQLLQVRQEIMSEIRLMEDKVSELKFRISRLERRLT